MLRRELRFGKGLFCTTSAPGKVVNDMGVN